jgi:spore germination cell wall hydrolase CwlJ-like protein
MMKRILGAIAFATGVAYYTPLAIPPDIPPTPADDVCMAWVVHDEARGESVAGQRAIIDIVLKRMEKRHLTACEVVKEKFQFSGYKRGMEIKLHENVSEKELAILYELYKMPPVVKSSEYFHAQYVKPTWRSKFERIKQIGKHIFYKEKEK